VVFAVVAGAGPAAFALTAAPATATASMGALAAGGSAAGGPAAGGAGSGGSVTVALVQPGVVRDPDAAADASEALTRDYSRDHPFRGPGSSGGRPAGTPGTAGTQGAGVDLVVWGESSIGDDLTLPSGRPLLRRIEGLSAEAGAEILVSQDAAPPGRGHEKWGVLVSPSGIKGTYVKTRLVPFGEYIPFRQQLGWLTAVSRAAGANMVPGTGAHLMQAVSRSGQPLPIGVATCFESAFPDMSRVDADAGARLMVYQSSTSTFQGTWGPDQHASLAALRAAETGRPVVQAALTGDSVAFDARGRQLAWLGQSSSGVVTVRLALPDPAARTFYDRHGDYVMWSGVVISAIAALLTLARRQGFLGRTAGGADNREAQYGEDTGQPVGR
jgi:apolipoprotein N-acyltransferase